MCLYPRIIQNPKYKANKKNNGNAPQANDIRTTMVPIGCGNCIECRRQKVNEWRIRMTEELKDHIGWYVTLTFSEEALDEIREYHARKNEGWEGCENEWATTAVRLFLERWRKKWKRSCRHWLISELGHDNTERIHLHGIIWENEIKMQYLSRIWQYGWADIGEYCNLRTINYIVKYITKIDNDHPEFNGKILCSPGIGDRYIKKINGKKVGEGYRFNVFRGKYTKEYYLTPQGYKLQLPIYYRNYIYTEEQREKLWIQKLDEQQIWIMGTSYDISTPAGRKEYEKALLTAQKDNIKNGYKGIKWDKNIYAKSLKKANNFH